MDRPQGLRDPRRFLLLLRHDQPRHRGADPVVRFDEFNDHHFHYGYFLRSAAVLGGADPAWLATYRPFVELLVRDLAADYDDSATVGGVATQFAAYNYFDPYSGHANAAGGQQYANGINQESSSEAVNAWYGMLLWADLVADRSMKARAAFMYCSEADAARALLVPGGFAAFRREPRHQRHAREPL